MDNLRPRDFDREVDRGPECYDRAVGRWWLARSKDRSHVHAYQKIARYLGSKLPNFTGTIVDYACGPGSLFVRLYRCLPRARLVGIDGSAMLLTQAEQRFVRLGAPHVVEWIKSPLPSFSLLTNFADVVIYCFPHIVPHPDEQDYYAKHGLRHKDDKAVAHWLAKKCKADPEGANLEEDVDTLRDQMLMEKVITRNHCALLKPRGLCVRVEYSSAARKELTDLEQVCTAFKDGSLANPIDGRRAHQLFRLASSRYFRSRAVDDVYHQTGNEEDRGGGYIIDFLRAI